MLDRDESGLHATQMSIEGRALLDSDSLVLCDIRDADAVRAVFARVRPDVVFHAAALKHLTLLERFPAEALKTNVVGTLNVLEAARGVGVSTFVNISTDKAARPTCVLGWSKRIAERLTAAVDGEVPEARYISVRFGNVLGSRGSVVVAFAEQIRNGGPVTVTHPEVERYFMLIPEACQLVLQAGAIGTGGEVMVLDMGTPVKIVDVARTMIRMSGRKDVDIVFTGLRPGEKLSEELFTPGEEVTASSHPLLITQVTVPALSPAAAGDVRAARQRAGPAPGCSTSRAMTKGLCMTERIHLSKAHVTDLEEQLVLEAIRSGWVAPLGPMVDRFEREVAERVGVAGALALSSGTAALHLALLELGAGPGRTVIVPSMTFAASANAVAYTGADLVLVDSDPADGNVDVALLLHAVDTLVEEGADVAAVMAVDLFGRCADYSTLAPELQRRGIPLVEDAAESLGASTPAGPRAPSVASRPCRSTATRS